MKKVMLVGVFVASLFSGCVMPDPQQLLAQSTDKQMAQAFLGSDRVSKYEEIDSYSSTPDIIVLENYISEEKGHIDVNIADAVNEYSSSFDSSTDPVAQRYMKVAKSRGSIVKMYKTSVNAAIAKVVPNSNYMNNSPYRRYDLDPAFIEYDKDGKIKSFLIRKHVFRSVRMFGGIRWMHYRYSQIVYGNRTRVIEINIGNDVLENGYIRTL